MVDDRRMTERSHLVRDRSEETGNTTWSRSDVMLETDSTLRWRDSVGRTSDHRDWFDVG